MKRMFMKFICGVVDSGLFGFLSIFFLVFFIVMSTIGYNFFFESEETIIMFSWFSLVVSVAIYGIFFITAFMADGDYNDDPIRFVGAGPIAAGMRNESAVGGISEDTTHDEEWTAEKINRLMREGRIHIDTSDDDYTNQLWLGD